MTLPDHNRPCHPHGALVGHVPARYPRRGLHHPSTGTPASRTGIRRSEDWEGDLPRHVQTLRKSRRLAQKRSLSFLRGVRAHRHQEVPSVPGLGRPAKTSLLLRLAHVPAHNAFLQARIVPCSTLRFAQSSVVNTEYRTPPPQVRTCESPSLRANLGQMHKSRSKITRVLLAFASSRIGGTLLVAAGADRIEDRGVEIAQPRQHRAVAVRVQLLEHRQLALQCRVTLPRRGVITSTSPESASPTLRNS